MALPLLAILAPILSISILTLGNGFYTTFTSVQLQHFDASLLALGLISSAYFLGALFGSYYTQHMIVRTGHIRSFAVFASLMVVGVLLQACVQNVWVWALVRALCGYSLAGLFIAVESWLLAYSTPSTKGRILALYLFVYYCVQTLSQLLLSIPFSNALFAFMLIAGLSSLSIIPVAVTRCEVPESDSPQLLSIWTVLKKSPLGLTAALVSGMVLGVVYTVQPYFLGMTGSSTKQIAWVMAATVMGGAILQIPIGKLSDKLDRRYMLFAVSFLTVAVAAAGLLVKQSFLTNLILGFLLGGFTFTLYPLGMNLTTDAVEKNASTSAIALITLIYGLGSALGPLLVSGLIKLMGPKGYFAYMLLIVSMLALYSLYHSFQLKLQHKRHFEASAPESALLNEQRVEE